MGIARIANRPAVREAAGVLVDVVADRIKARRADAVPPSTGERTAMVEQAATQIAASPQLTNALNAEPFWQSRVIVGLTTAFVGFGLDRVEWGDTENFILTNIGLFLEGFGLLVGAIGRTVKGLAPIDWRKPWTILGIGR